MNKRPFLLPLLILAACSDSPEKEEVVDPGDPPAAPEFLRTDPASPGNVISLRLVGNAPADTAVQIFRSDDCSGEVFSTGTAEEFAGAGITIGATVNETSLYSARAVDAAEQTSDCSEPIDFLQDNIAPSVANTYVWDGAAEDEDLTNTAGEMAANWSPFEDTNGVVKYEYNISASSACKGEVVDTVDVATALQHSTPNLLLQDATTYYNCIRATDAAGNTSLWRSSNGILIDISAPAVVESTPLPLEEDTIRRGQVTIVLSEKINADTVTPNSIALMQDATVIPGSVVIESNHTTATLLFQSDEPLITGTTYTATLQAGISDPAGNLIESETSWNFTTCSNCWAYPSTVSDTATSGRRAEVAVAPNGNAVIVWTQANDPSTNIYAITYSPGNGWSTPTRVDSSDEGSASNHIVTIDDTAAYVTWTQSDGTTTRLWSARFTEANSWEAPMTINDAASPAGNPNITTDGSGNAFVTWRQRGADTTTSFTWVNVYKNGSWGTPLAVSNNNSATKQVVVAAQNGSAMALWQESTPDASVWTSLYNSSTSTWGVPVLASVGRNPSAAIDNSGNVTLLFTLIDETQTSVFSARFEPATGWGTAVLLEEDESGNATIGNVATDAAGNAIAVWFQRYGSFDDVWAARYEIGVGWGDPELIEKELSDAGEVRVAVNPAGEATALFQQANGGLSAIYSTGFTPADGWGERVLIDAGKQSTSKPRIGLASDGTAIGVWEAHTTPQRSVRVDMREP